MKSGNLRSLHILYWRHSTEDQENARTTELFRELMYDDKLQIRLRDNLSFIFANVNRRTESYLANKSVVENLRSKKVKREPLVYLELWRPNEDQRKEEFWSIDSDYRLKAVLKRILFHLTTSY